MCFGRSEHLLEHAQNPLKLLPLVCRIEDRLANALQAIAKQALGGPLKRLECSRIDLVAPSPHVPGPAKRYRQHPPSVSKRSASLKRVSSREPALNSIQGLPSPLPH